MKTLTTILIAVLLLASLGQVMGEAASADKEPVLTLSGLKCTGYQVDITFVLRNVSSGDQVSELVYKYGKIPPTKSAQPGDTYYFADVLESGYYDIEDAYVVVNNEKIYLSNPGDFKGDYTCGKSLIPSPRLPIKRPLSSEIKLIKADDFALALINR